MRQQIQDERETPESFACNTRGAVMATAHRSQTRDGGVHDGDKHIDDDTDRHSDDDTDRHSDDDNSKYSDDDYPFPNFRPPSPAALISHLLEGDASLFCQKGDRVPVRTVHVSRPRIVQEARAMPPSVHLRDPVYRVADVRVCVGRCGWSTNALPGLVLLCYITVCRRCQVVDDIRYP